MVEKETSLLITTIQMIERNMSVEVVLLERETKT